MVRVLVKLWSNMGWPDCGQT